MLSKSMRDICRKNTSKPQSHNVTFIYKVQKKKNARASTHNIFLPLRLPYACVRAHVRRHSSHAIQTRCKRDEGAYISCHCIASFNALSAQLRASRCLASLAFVPSLSAPRFYHSPLSTLYMSAEAGPSSLMPHHHVRLSLSHPSLSICHTPLVYVCRCVRVCMQS